MKKPNVQTSNLFYLFKRERGSETVGDLVGPIQESQIANLKLKYFENDTDVEILNEETFKLLYFDDFIDNFKALWAEQLQVYLAEMNIESHEALYILNDDGTFSEIEEEKEDEYDENTTIIEHLLIPEVGLIYIDPEADGLRFQILLSADPVLAGQIACKMAKFTQGVMEFNIDEHIYEDLDGVEHTGQNAIQVYNMEKLGYTNLN